MLFCRLNRECWLTGSFLSIVSKNLGSDGCREGGSAMADVARKIAATITDIARIIVI